MNSPKENRVPGGALFTGLFNEAFVANPFPLFTQLRSKGAVVAMPMPGRGSTSLWMITRLEEAVQVLKNKVFTVIQQRSRILLINSCHLVSVVLVGFSPIR